MRDRVSGREVAKFTDQHWKFGGLRLTAVTGSPSGDLAVTGVTVVALTVNPSNEQLTWLHCLESEPVGLFRVGNGARIASRVARRAPKRQAKET